jgi:hypothetical protein
VWERRGKWRRMEERRGKVRKQIDVPLRLSRFLQKCLPLGISVLISGLDHRWALILFQLHTGHIGLNHYLFCIHKSEAPVCPNCQGLVVETIKHYILKCLQYQQK